MSRTSYRWNAADWAKHYFDRSFNMGCLSVFNAGILVMTLGIAMGRHINYDQLAVLPALLVAANLVVFYTYLGDIAHGIYARIACGVTAGLPLAVLVMGLDMKLPLLVPALFGLALATYFAGRALGYYLTAFKLVPVTAAAPTRSASRRHF